MNHEPSDYVGSVTLTIQQMIEIEKAINARIVYLVIECANDIDSELDRQLSVRELQEANQALLTHINKALDEYEAKVAEREASALDDDEALRRFIDDDK